MSRAPRAKHNGSAKATMGRVRTPKASRNGNSVLDEFRTKCFGSACASLRMTSGSLSRAFRRADFHAFAFKSCAQFARKFDGARCIAVDTDRFAAHLDILAFD